MNLLMSGQVSLPCKLLAAFLAGEHRSCSERMEMESITGIFRKSQLLDGCNWLFIFGMRDLVGSFLVI